MKISPCTGCSYYLVGYQRYQSVNVNSCESILVTTIPTNLCTTTYEMDYMHESDTYPCMERDNILINNKVFGDNILMALGKEIVVI